VITASKSIFTTLSKLAPEKSLLILNKYFREEILHNEKYLKILTDCLLNPIINNWLPLSNKTIAKIDDGKTFEWHHDFRYQLYINELIVETIVKIVNNQITDDNFRKNQILKIIKQ
jgi:hypothetical protein